MGARWRARLQPAAVRGEGAEAVQPEAGGVRGGDLGHVQGVVHGVQGRRRPAATLHPHRQEQGRDQEDHLPVLCLAEDPVREGVRGHHETFRGELIEINQHLEEKLSKLLNMNSLFSNLKLILILCESILVDLNNTSLLSSLHLD